MRIPIFRNAARPDRPRRAQRVERNGEKEKGGLYLMTLNGGKTAVPGNRETSICSEILENSYMNFFQNSRRNQWVSVPRITSVFVIGAIDWIPKVRIL